MKNDDAYAEGADAWYAGKPMEANPYLFDSPEYQDWMTGWENLEHESDEETAP